MTPDRPVSTRSLRLRVGLIVLSLLLVVLVALGFVVNALLKDRLESELRQRVRDRAGLAQALAGQGFTSQALSDRLTGAGITATVTTSDGVTVGRDQPRFARGPGVGARPQRPPAATNVTITQDGPQLTATVPLTDGSVTLTASLIDVERTLSALRTIEFVAGAATLLVVALLLWRLVGVALAPLGRMTTLANRIRDGARGSRLRATRPNTDIGRTAAAFDGMLDSLETAEATARAAEERMRQFLADASHDLRTPLAGVIISAEQVLRENPERLLREQQLVTLIREARRAARLVDDLLLIARLDAPAPAPTTPVDVSRIVATAAAQAPRPVLVSAAASAWALADPDDLHRILANLLDNAVRASPPGAGIRIGLRGTQDGNGATVQIDVADDGPGIPPEQRGRAFDRFVRLTDAADGRPASGGHGLGLPIARGLARRHGGDLVYVDASLGATFRLTLPAAPTAPSERQDVVVALVVDRGDVVAHS